MTATSIVAAPPEGYTGRRTAPALWRHALAQGWQTPAFLAEEATGWHEVSWEEAGQRIDGLACGLLARGVGHGDKVAICSRTRLEWTLLDWAVMSIGAVVVGVYPSATASECAFVLGHADAMLLVVEGDEQLATVAQVRDQLPLLRDVLRIEELDQLEREGHQSEITLPEVAEDDVAALIYTSGTTGQPKGVMLTHRNVVASATHAERPLANDDDVMLLFLPLAHCYGQLVAHSAAFLGYTTAFCADVTRLGEAMEHIRPTVLPAVPRVYEKVHAAVVGQVERSSRVRRAIGRWALRIGREVSRQERDERRPSKRLRVQRALADRLVFAKARARLGGRLRYGGSGAAPLSLDVLEFFHALGVLIIEGYGLTETAGSATANHPEDYRFGTVGQALEGCEVRLAADGEILLRSDTVFSGYYKDPDATRRTFDDDGWFRTGDVGALDTNGFLTITDRKKDLIVTAGGKNVAPQNLENELKASRFVSQALVVGDRRPYLTALITVDAAELAAAGREPEGLIRELVASVNQDRAGFEQIKRFRILPREFTIEQGEVTPTLKLRRSVIVDRFAGVIEELYADL